MEYEVKKVVKVDIKYFYVNIGARYLEDSCVNGVEAKEDGSDTPFFDKEDKRVKFTIDVDSGEILNYPKGTSWKIQYKVCDDGIYEIIDDKHNVIEKLEYEYVPTCLAIEDSGYGDYVIMNVDENGIINNWNPHFEDNFKSLVGYEE